MFESYFTAVAHDLGINLRTARQLEEVLDVFRPDGFGADDLAAAIDRKIQSTHRTKLSVAPVPDDCEGQTYLWREQFTRRT